MIKTSSITRLSKNLLLLIDIAKSDKVDIYYGGDFEDKIFKNLLFRPKNLNKITGYLLFNAKPAFA